MAISAQGCFHEANFIDNNGSLKIIRLPVVQELARQGLETLSDVFSIALPDPSLSSKELAFIPAIDVAKLRVGSEPKARAEELAKLASGAKEWGLFLIKNHGIEESLLDEVEGVSKGFFELSFEEKKASVGTYMSKDNMGYGRNFMEANDHQMVDWVDRLTMKAAPKEADGGLNVWPKTPANFR